MGEETPRDDVEHSRLLAQEIEAIERERRAETHQLYRMVGVFAACAIIGAMFMLGPMIAGSRAPKVAGRILAGAIFLLPIILPTIWVWRHERLPIGPGAELTGAKARLVAIGLLTVAALLVVYLMIPFF